MTVKRIRRGLTYILILVAIIFIIWGVRNNRDLPETILISDVAAAAREGEIERVTVEGNEMLITFTDGSRATAIKDPSTSAPEQLAALGVSEERLSDTDWEVVESHQAERWLAALTYILPLVFVIAVIYILLRQAQKEVSERIRSESDDQLNDGE